MGGGTPSLEAYPCRVLELWMRAALNPCPCPVPAQPHTASLEEGPRPASSCLCCQWRVPYPCPACPHQPGPLGAPPPTFSHHPLHLPLGLHTFPHLAGPWCLGCLSLTSCETLSLSPTPIHLTPTHTGTVVGRYRTV